MEYKSFYRRRLPHVHPKNGIFFITYRLHFSLPKVIIESLRRERLSVNKNISISVIEKRLFAYYDKLLAEDYQSPLWLAKPWAAKIVIDSLLFNHNKKYELICVVVMPNHVHTLLRTSTKEFQDFYTIPEILANHKKYTVRLINKGLKRKGQFWQHEGYDHFVRNERKLNRIIQYVLLNPVKAGLIDDYKRWHGLWMNPEYADINRK